MFYLRKNICTLKIWVFFPLTVYCFCSMKNDVLWKKINIIFRSCRTNIRIRYSRLIASGEIV